MNKITTIILAVSILFFLGACGTKTIELESSTVLQQYKSINELNQLLKVAEKNDVPTLAPEGYSKSKEIYNNAFDKATAQQAGANELAATGIERLRLAMKNTDTSKEVFRDVLEARSKTMEADAQNIFPEKFSDLESRLKDAAMDVEKGKVEDAKEQRAGLIKDYAALELSALKTDVTQKSKDKVAEAEKSRADKYAPKTFKLAQEELALALDVLSAGRTQKNKAQEHAILSVYYADKSMHITDMIIEFNRRDFTEEEILLWYQDQLELINKPFDKSLAMDRPNYDVVIDVQGRIIELQDKAKTLSDIIAQKDQQLASASENIAMLEGQIDSMGSQYKRVSEESRRAEARYKRIQNMFTEDEAYVYRQDNNVLLETHAFNFKVGGSEIDSGNYALLEKIMDAIKVFNNPDIMIMGHTDSTGGDAINQQLSEKRAKTVTSFLQKIGKFPPNKISSKGYGESRPVASNETREGRERNRRIEVLIINK